MKRVLLLFVSLSMTAVTMMAGEKNANAESEMWSWNVNTGRLSDCLQLGSNQYDQVKMISEYFADRLSAAAHGKNDERKSELVRYAVNANLKLMKETLDEAQYKKYVMLLNLTLKNKGLDVYLINKDN